ncbi:H/ACA ribonucleoprotein complex non-core subunit NAF1 [Cynoglossus semilaevis]|uniref:H/ACA ribonucleoprotein complex non-core subunit NAF1 n=1 Tax=Cynoglossus semilaevis TaxID=244447 RepID=A0A3P8VP18_CYNSE|nr:H/ACA ribonucleoprotein complex non-core subunit NAF1 [Cynoglossus semilaevis]
MDKDTDSGPGQKNDVEHMNNDVTAMNSDITDTNIDIIDMNSDITGINNVIADTNNDITDTTSENTGMKNDIDTNNKITDTNNDVTDMNSENTGMNIDITDLTGDIITAVSSESRQITEKEQDGTSAPPVHSVRRTEVDSEGSDSDSSDSSSSSSSSPALVFGGDEDDDEGYSQRAPVRTRDEVLLEELPAVEDVCISLPDDVELKPVGTISGIIKQLVIVQSLKDTPPLSDDSIIFTADRVAVGKVFEVFGPVSSPLYILRVGSLEQLSSRGLTEGLTLYYAPENEALTVYVLTQQLKLLKGSDASWKNDQEPPEEALDFSDDEKEKEAKTKAKKKRRPDNNTTGNPAHITHKTFQQQQQQHPDVRTFSPRHSASLQHNQRNYGGKQPTYGHAFHHQMPPTCLPPPCPYPPPMFPPPAYNLYPPPPGAAPSFFHPSWATPAPFPPHFWHPYTDVSSAPPPPPPPPPPQ